MTQEELAKAVHTTKQTIYKYEQDIITNIPWERVEGMATALGISSAYIMGWTDSPGIHTRSVPRVGAIACGSPITAEQNIEGYDEVPDFVKCDYTIVCKGDSMTGARINDGDIVCVRACSTARNGDIAVVGIEGEDGSYEATLKRIRFVDNGIMLCPENLSYVPLVFAGEQMARVHIQGVATHFISTIK